MNITVESFMMGSKYDAHRTEKHADEKLRNLRNGCLIFRDTYTPDESLLGGMKIIILLQPDNIYRSLAIMTLTV